MRKPVEPPFKEAMRFAFVLARTRKHRSMAPIVHQWADAMKRGIIEAYHGR